MRWSSLKNTLAAALLSTAALTTPIAAQEQPNHAVLSARNVLAPPAQVPLSTTIKNQVIATGVMAATHATLEKLSGNERSFGDLLKTAAVGYTTRVLPMRVIDNRLHTTAVGGFPLRGSLESLAIQSIEHDFQEKPLCDLRLELPYVKTSLPGCSFDMSPNTTQLLGSTALTVAGLEFDAVRTLRTGLPVWRYDSQSSGLRYMDGFYALENIGLSNRSSKLKRIAEMRRGVTYAQNDPADIEHATTQLDRLDRYFQVTDMNETISHELAHHAQHSLVHPYMHRLVGKVTSRIPSPHLQQAASALGAEIVHTPFFLLPHHLRPFEMHAYTERTSDDLQDTVFSLIRLNGASEAVRNHATLKGGYLITFPNRK